MLKILVYFLALTSFFMPGDAFSAEEWPQGAFENMRDGGQDQVIGILDPLTVQLKSGKSLRLVGLDIPDFDPYEPGDISITVMKVLSDMLGGQSVQIHQTKKKNKAMNKKQQQKMNQTMSCTADDEQKSEVVVNTGEHSTAGCHTVSIYKDEHSHEEKAERDHEHARYEHAPLHTSWSRF